jgi:hypothetical protein
MCALPVVDDFSVKVVNETFNSLKSEEITSMMTSAGAER